MKHVLFFWLGGEGGEDVDLEPMALTHKGWTQRCAIKEIRYLAKV